MDAPLVAGPTAKRGAAALDQFEALRRKGADIPAALFAEVAKCHQQLGDLQKAEEMYRASAARYIRDEAWTHAAAVVKKARRITGRPTASLSVLSLQIALGRGEADEACRALDELSRLLAPSEGEVIEQVIGYVDAEVLAEPEVELALSEMLTVLGRPDRAIERIRVACVRARRAGRMSMAADLENRLREIGGALPDQAEVASVPASPALPPMAPTPVAPRPASLTESPAPAVTPVAAPTGAQPLRDGQPPLVAPPSDGGPAESAPAAGTAQIAGVDLPPLPSLDLADLLPEPSATPPTVPPAEAAPTPAPLPVPGATPDVSMDVGAPSSRPALGEIPPLLAPQPAPLSPPADAAAGAPTATSPVSSPISPIPSAPEPGKVAPVRFDDLGDVAFLEDDGEAESPRVGSAFEDDGYVKLDHLRESEPHTHEVARIVGTDGRAEYAEEDAQMRHLVGTLLDGLRQAVPEDEVETHYELGITFLQMGMFDEAVEKFQVAFRSPALRKRAAEGLAQAFLERGDAILAHRAARMTREEIGGDDAGVLGLLYWQARAAEALSRTPEAVDLYERIAVQNAAFQDALMRLRALTAAG